MSFPGVLLSSLGPSVGYRGNVDGPNYHILMTEFPFNVDGRILEWYFYANSVGQARFQVTFTWTAIKLEPEANDNESHFEIIK